MQNGYNLSFLNWMIIAVPVSIVIFLIWCKILFWIFKPQKMDENAYNWYLESNNIKWKLEGKEILLLCIIIAIILLSIIIPSFFNIQTELLICSLAVLVLLPAFKLVDYEQLEKSGAITQSLCVCMFISISAILSTTWVAWVIVNWMQSLLPTDPSITIVLLILCVMCIIMGNIMPSTAVPPLLAMPMILLSQSYWFSPILLLIPLAMLSNCTWILPMDPVTIIPFWHRQFTLWNIVKPWISLWIISIIITVAWVTIVAWWWILSI
jgi:sodium-dependent dicarboxylate transporter 2/3/5